jgi:hypothetical protein
MQTSHKVYSISDQPYSTPSYLKDSVLIQRNTSRVTGSRHQSSKRLSLTSELLADRVRFTFQLDVQLGREHFTPVLPLTIDVLLNNYTDQ